MAKKGAAKKGAGWSDMARKKAAMTRKAKKKVTSSGRSGMGSEKKLDFYEARRKAGQGSRLIQDQVKRAYDYRESSNTMWKTNPKKSEKLLVKAEKLDGMIERNEKRLKKLIKKYRIDKNPN